MRKNKNQKDKITIKFHRNGNFDFLTACHKIKIDKM